MSLKHYETKVEIRDPKSETISNTQGPKYPNGTWLSSIFHPPPSIVENILRLAALGLALLCLAGTKLRACGPGFPNNLLSLGDNAVLLAPVADFQRELERMNVTPNRFRAVPAAGSFSAQTLDAEMADLGAALRKAKVPRAECERICREHQAGREKLRQFLADLNDRQSSRPWIEDENGGHEGEPILPWPEFPKIEFAPGLPAEFADYLDGALAWHNPAVADKSVAREAWERLLARPAEERKFKSTWAAFMLGRSWEGQDVEKAAAYFRQVRELAGQGFVDSAGLAAASYGLEARVFYQGGSYAHAIELYLAQLATGDPSAPASLQQVADTALGESSGLRELATNALARKVITAQAISCRSLIWSNHGNGPNQTNEVTARWLNAVEAAGVKDVESTERLALAAYQAGAFDLAQRWIARSSNAPVAQWLQAKLLLRAGKIPEAAALLAKVARRLPVSDAGHRGKREFADDVVMTFDEYDNGEVPTRRQVLGELGVLRLSRGEFTEALDALLRAGFWMDAAYVAERVLTAEELKDYVDRCWPAGSAAGGGQRARPPVQDDPQAVHAAADGESSGQPVSSALLGTNIRHLLARRLTREIHGDVARAYYPAEWQPRFDELASALLAGWDERQPADQRATALFRAACIARTNGIELLGTEVQPDWHVWDGDFEHGVTRQQREGNEPGARINIATPDELQRAAQHHADPEVRFHYRYQAAFLGWEAAKLMPDNADETARVLWTAGSWLKVRDPETADIFYKALVRRCRQTALGGEADRIRWFPRLDENGNVIRRTPAPALKTPPEAPTTLEPGDELESATRFEEMEATELDSEEPPIDSEEAENDNVYVVQKGDTLAAILRASEELGVPLTIEELVGVNPGINLEKLRVGQRMIIPKCR